MTKSRRFYFQVLLWLVIWIIIWVVGSGDSRFLEMNGPTFVLQILLLLGLIHYAVPQLLLEKKYGLFFLITIPSLLIAAYFATQMTPAPPFPGPPGPPPGDLPNGLIRRYPIHLLVLAISSIIAVVLEIFVDAQQKEKRFAVAKAELIESELKLLKLQMNPHFLFNSLNNIYALSAIDPKKTQQSISSLSNMLRYVLYECEQAYVPLRKEIDYIKNYLELYALKSSKTYPIETDFRIQNDTVLVAPMLFIPFVENALKHGNIEKIADAFLKIRLSSDSEKITFKIENSIPKTSVQKDKVGGIGLENVRKRLAILYPERHTLIIQEESDTFKVVLRIGLDGKNY